MIEFEVLNSPDKEVIGKHQFFIPLIKIGKSPLSNLPVNDSEFPLHGIYLHSSGKDLLIGSLNNLFYHFNGKKISGKMLIKTKDKIKVGQTEIVLLQYHPASIAQKLKLDINAASFDDSPLWEELFASIEKELLLNSD